MARLYIAYGSNMNVEQMAVRCPTAKLVGKTMMKNWRLLFCSVATIERHKGSKVPILVWDLQPEDEAALDIYEGYPRLYRKETVRIPIRGRKMSVMVYIMNSNRLSPPNASYLETIRDGYKVADFDIRILDEAVKISSERRKPYEFRY